jgi:hypothetical protein
VTWKPDYITLSDLKNFLHISPTDTQDDAEFSLWITAASRAADRRAGRQFGQLDAPAIRTYRRAPFWDPDACMWVWEIDDVQDVTALTVGGQALATAGATMLPDNAPADGDPYTQVGLTSWSSGPLVVSARWGWSAVPAQVKAAVRLQCNRWNFRRDAPAGIAGSPDQGSEVRMLDRLDPDVSVMLRGLERRRRAG